MFMHCRSGSYEWPWERFAIDYWVMDALWKTAQARGRVTQSGVSHAQRMSALCEKLGLHSDPTRTKAIVNLRNDLMHEALWDSKQPGESSSPESVEMPLALHRFNTRVFLAILSIPAAFIQTPWSCMGTFKFGLQA